ncbi:hypothetical protein FPV67DRAFT_1669327 [Lyophyllum atratum]|nr:hypothetical protein FPV67DRAFT_1669327 [Lyophyllum atratum]
MIAPSLSHQGSMASRSDLDFPHDLFYPILHYVKDMTFLWTDCRAVSRDFSQAAERIFIEKHLKNKTWLAVDCGMWRSQKYGKVYLACDFQFDRFDPSNPARAIFADKGKCVPEYRPELISRLRSRLAYGNPAHNPKILVQIRREVNDTAVPGLEVDYDGLEMSVEWKSMISAFLREEKEYSRRNAEWAESKKPSLRETRARIDGGELGEMEAIEKLLHMFGNMIHDTRKDLRRERICREVLEKDGVEWTWHGNEDARALEKLKDQRAALGWGEPYSDESDGDDDRDAMNEDSDEEDEDEDFEDEDEGDEDDEDEDEDDDEEDEEMEE